MEQTVNQFNKGLQMDTHPMVQGTDTLSDALNATFVTMSGNEVILQNDMGNRKIDNAQLPSGYEPVGMKEYGGIIYVAAYNPLTNRGQLGSFPSPQRKLSTRNTEQLFSFSNFLNKPNPGESYKIAVDNITIPISDGLVLHTGDKFSVYSNEIKDIIQYLIPTESQGMKKNNLFTFQIGIFNSQNEFVDISDKLINQEIKVVKQENNKDIIYTYNYYITENSGIDQNQQLQQNTLSDQKLLEARNSIAVNTYSYKMSSPLYLRAKLNHVNSISYTIDGDIVGESEGTKDVDFYISVTYHYNCIDRIRVKKEPENSEGSEESSAPPLIIDTDDPFPSNEQGESEGNYVNKYFELIFNGDYLNPIIPLEKEINPIYYEELDEYRLTLNYVARVTGITSTTYNYKLEFPLLHDFEQFTFKDANNNIIPIIQNNLTQENSIDIALLGSDAVLFSGYRYLFNNTSKLVTLELDIKSYPKKVGSNYEIVPAIYNENENNNLYRLTPIQGENENSPISGVYTIIFNYKQLGLEERKLYHIKLQKHDTNYDDISKQDTNQGVESGLFITTPIFNGNYIGSKAFEEGITLVTIKNKTGNYEAGGYEYEVAKDDYIDNFLKIKYLLLNPIINVTTNKYSAKTGQEIKGQLINERDYEQLTSTYDIIEKYEVNTEINPTISLNNIELYPSELDDKFSIEDGSLIIGVSDREIDGNQVEHDNGTYKYSKNLVETRGSYTNNENVTNNIEDVIKITQSIVGQKITTKVTVHNFIQGNVIEASILCNRVITSLYDFIVKHYFDNSGFFHISDPYVTIDFEGSSSKLGVRLDYGTISNQTFNEDNSEKIFTTSIHNQNIINDFFRQKTGNLLLLEYSDNDYLIGRGPVYIGLKGQKGIKRIWMRVSEKEYTPIFAESIQYSNENLSIDIFNDGSWEFRTILDEIPHYYSYSEDSKTIERKVIDYHNLAATKEFSVTSNANVSISCTSLLNISSTYYKIKNSTVGTQINIQEDNIKSNNVIQEDLNTLSTLELDCVLETTTYDAISMATSDRKIIYKDREGNPFDPAYVYYIYDWYDPDKGFQKSYKADKFYVDDLGCNFPELKDSGQLYHASNGDRHPYVNPIVSTTKGRREREEKFTVGWLTNIPIYNDSKIGTTYTYDFSSLYNDISNKNLLKKTSDDYFIGGNSYAYYSLPAFLTLSNNKVGYNNKVTMAQYEPGDWWFGYATFTSRNIFDQNTIARNELYYWEGEDNENPMKDSQYGWRNADDFISK